MRLFRRKSESERVANILDPIHDQLDPRMWDNAAAPEPKLKAEHSEFIHQKVWTTLEENGYDGMERWLSLVLTGSLTTYQYADSSDCDISLWVNVQNFPEWSRGEMIGIMVKDCDGTLVPGTPFPLQDFVVSSKLTKQDLYKPGMRSGYDMAMDQWIVPPDKSRVHDVEHEMNLAYTQGLEAADKMDRLLQFEPLQAIRYWHVIHKKRQRDMANGMGDYATSNVVYKTLANRGMFERISELTGEHIAKIAANEYGSLDEVSAAHPNVESFAAERPWDGHITLNGLKVAPENQGNGYASAYLRDLTGYADQNGKIVAMNAEPYAHGGLGKTKLRQWYGTHGFVPNKGRNKDFAFSEQMIRQPR